jgi:hypothetical protein
MRSILAAALICELIAAPAAFGQSQGTIVPSLSITTLHDENVFSTPSAIGDFITTFRPSLEGLYESPTVSLQSLFSFDMQRAGQHSALNTLDARRQGLFDIRARTTPAITLGFAARYDQTQTPGDLNIDTGIMLGRQRAQRIQVTPSLAYRTTTKTTVNAAYDWIGEELSREVGGDLHSARLGISRRISPLTTLSARYLGRLFADDVEINRSHAALLGWSREMAPGTTLSLEAGPRFTSHGDPTAEVLAALLRRTPRTRFLLDYWRGETIVLGIQGPVEIHSGSTKMNWALRRNLDLGTALAVFRSATLEQREALVYHASIVGAWSREPYILSISYGADLQHGNIRTTRPADERVLRGVLSVRMTVAPRLSRAFSQPDDADRPTTPLKGVVP